MEQYFGAVPPAGEHTVLNAYAVGRTDERSKTFLIPFGVYQKEFACRGESRPGGSDHQQDKTRPRQQSTAAVAKQPDPSRDDPRPTHQGKP
jgi:hypothetical protein